MKRTIPVPSSFTGFRYTNERCHRLRAKLKTISEQFDTRDLHYRGLLRGKDSEIQSLASKFEDQRRANEVEANRSRALTSQVSTFSHTEAELRSQLNIYVEKFKQVRKGSHNPPYPPADKDPQVEDTLNNSNDLFLTFRKEMEEMSKKTKRLEKENHTLNRKHEQTNRNILEMAEERTRNHEELERWRRKCHHLEALCRRMQAQGRGEGLALAEGDDHLEGDDEGTESEYDDDYEDDEEDISDEEDLEPSTSRVDQPSEKPVFGPTPPPNLLEARANGNAAGVNGLVF
jgi:DNA repair exonuclease SbcCD ATPase subunit